MIELPKKDKRVSLFSVSFEKLVLSKNEIKYLVEGLLPVPVVVYSRTTKHAKM